MDTDRCTGVVSIPVPDGTYNSFTLKTDWVSGGGAWSREAIWAIANNCLDDSTTVYYTHPGPNPESARNPDSVSLTWGGFLDLPIHGPHELWLLPLQTYGDSPSRWGNTVLELSFQMPPSPPALTADLGIVASEFRPFNITTFKDSDTELAVYSPTSRLVAENDDRLGREFGSGDVTSRIDFGNGLPAGDYIAAVGMFNTNFNHAYEIDAGAVGGDYGLQLPGNLFEGTLAAGEIAYVGFTIGTALSGDFNRDGQLSVADIDMLTAQIAAGTPGDPIFDVTDDGIVDNADLMKWRTDAASHNGFGEAYLFGDSNLDGSVNATDLNNLALSWRQDTTQWSGGNFAVDGVVDSTDLNALALNWGQSIPLASSASAQVPEPTALYLMIFGLAIVGRFRIAALRADFLSRQRPPQFQTCAQPAQTPLPCSKTDSFETLFANLRWRTQVAPASCTKTESRDV